MNSFGRIFRVSVYGESHGKGLGVLLDGVPAGLELEEKDFKKDMSRRSGGFKGATPRKESDIPQLINGIFNGKTTGAPLNIFFKNRDTDSSVYEELQYIPRPGHSDFTAFSKFGGFNDFRGSGHFSGRITAGIVAAGVVAKKILKGMEFTASLIEIDGDPDIDNAIERIVETEDSCGGIIKCTIKNVPVGLGEPFFDSVESLLAHMLFSIPAVKGVEFGSGFEGARMKGSENNDPFISVTGKRASNNSGGIEGGISNGMDIFFRIAVKPTSSIGVEQESVNLVTGEKKKLKVEGRHDSCIALRVPVL